MSRLLTLSPWLLFGLKLTLVLAAAWLLHLALRRANPGWRIWLWRGVALALLSWPSLAFVTPRFEVKIATPTLVVTTPINSAVPSRSDTPTTLEAPAREFMRPPTPAPLPPALTIPRPWPKAWVFLGVWLVGALILGARFLLGKARVRRLIDTSEPAPEFVLDAGRSVARHLGCRREFSVRLRAELATPILARVWRPVVVLPQRLVQESSEQSLRCVLAHELSHLKSHDLFWSCLLHWVTSVLWFHPLTWRVRAAHDAACEEVSDAVAAHVVGSREAYSQTLARIALELAGRAPTLAAIPMARRAEITRRLERLKRFPFSLVLNRRAAMAWSAAGLGFMTWLAGARVVVSGGGKSLPIVASSQELPEMPPGFGLRQPSAAFGSVGQIKSARGLAQSKTLARGSVSLSVDGPGGGQTPTAPTLAPIPRTASTPPLLGVTPEMQKKSVSQLLREVSWTKWFNTSNWTYLNRLVELGSDAVPEMIQVLREARRQPFVRQLRLDPPGQPPNAPLLETVVKALGEIGPGAAAAVPDLIEVFEETEDEMLVQHTGDALRSIGPDAKAAIPALRNAVKRKVRVALSAWAAIEPGSPELLDTLLEIVKQKPASATDDRQRQFRFAAVAVLGTYGPRADTAVPALESLLAEEPKYAARTVIDALLKIRPAAALPILTPGFESADLDVRLHSALALAAFDDTRPRAFAVLKDLLERWESEAKTVPPDTRTYPANDATSGIEPMPGKIPWQVGNVCGFLTRPELQAAEMAPALSRLVTSPYRHVAQNAALALAQIGPPARPAAPALTDALKHDSGLVRVNAALALAKVDRQIEAGLKVLIAELKHPVREVRGTAARYLVELGEDARPALPELRRMLNDPLDLPRVHAARAVWKLDRQPDEVVPALISLLEYSIRMTGAMAVLGEIGPPAKAAIPILRKAAKTRWSAKANEALARIDPETFGKEVTP